MNERVESSPDIGMPQPKVNTLTFKQNGWHHVDNIFECIFFKEFFYILFEILIEVYYSSSN